MKPSWNGTSGPASGKAAWRPISRRQAMQWGGLGAVTWFWSDWLRAAGAGPTRAAKARSVILIFNCGGPSHLDLWDPKPQAPDNVRGPFRSISTSVPGIGVSELLPQVAQRMEKLALVRSVHHRHGAHNAGMYWSIVGRPYPVDSTLINPSRMDLPSFGTLVGWLAQRDGYSGAIPPYVITPAPHCDSTAYITPGQFGGCLGARFDPLVLNSDPNAKDFKVPNIGLSGGMTADRMEGRRHLLGQLDSLAVPVSAPAASDYRAAQEKAMALVTSERASRAFDLSQEPDSVRQRYGRHTWGQSHLLARRLVEAGVPFVTTVNGQSIVWDTHQDNFDKLRKRLVPPMEQAYVALLDDLEERGLLESTLVVWMGDFGRTPIINKDAGRDHWPQCYSMALAGGGIRGGQVIGQSDATGSYPIARAVTPADIHATVFSALGYAPSSITYHTADGRPVPLSDGHPITELL